MKRVIKISLGVILMVPAMSYAGPDDNEQKLRKHIRNKALSLTPKQLQELENLGIIVRNVTTESPLEAPPHEVPASSDELQQVLQKYEKYLAEKLCDVVNFALLTEDQKNSLCAQSSRIDNQGNMLRKKTLLVQTLIMTLKQFAREQGEEAARQNARRVRFAS